MAEPIIHHRGLNTTFKGIEHPISSSENEIWQFRGIKYADIPARFRQSSLNSGFPPVVDATTYGLKCPQTIFPIRMEDCLIGLPPTITSVSHAPDIFDEFNCLNLNITIPSGTKAGDDLPVMVYVHGGGGFSGANSDWWCDGGSIVKRSVEIGRPVIMVAINYRLGVFGYMGSEELGEVNGKDNTANFGPRDIHTALTWISQNITPFGGSPSSITIYGESHGSIAIATQLHSSPSFPTLLHRAIMQSQTLGAPLFATPLSLSTASSLYSSTKSALGLSTAKELGEVEWEKLVEAYQKSDPRNGFGHVPVIDGVFFLEDWKEEIKNMGRELLLGCTGNESSVVKMVVSGAPASDPRPSTLSFTQSLSSLLGEAKVGEIFETYRIVEGDEGEVVGDKLLEIIEDVCWYRDQERFANLAKEQGIKVREYTFDQNQPFAGPFVGVPSHSLDLAYLHGDPAIFDGCESPEKERAMQRGVQDAWIRFANGDGEKGQGEEEVKKFGPDGEIESVSKERFLGDLRRVGKWGVWDSIEHVVMEGVVGLIMVHLVRLLGQGVVLEQKRE